MSTLDQNEQRVLDGPTLDRTLTEKASGRDTVRSRRAELMRIARGSGTVVAHSMEQLVRKSVTCSRWSKL